MNLIAKYACKIGIQHISFAAPLTLAVPITTILVLVLEKNDICFFNTPFFGNFEFSKAEGNLFSKNVL